MADGASAVPAVASIGAEEVGKLFTRMDVNYDMRLSKPELMVWPAPNLFGSRPLHLPPS